MQLTKVAGGGGLVPFAKQLRYLAAAYKPCMVGPDAHMGGALRCGSGHHTHVWILSHSLDPDSGHSPCPQRPQLCILVRPPCHPRCSQDMTSLSALLSTKHCLDPMVSWTGARGRGKSWWDAYKMRLLLAQTTAVGHQGLHSPTPLPMLPFRPLVNMEGPL